MPSSSASIQPAMQAYVNSTPLLASSVGELPPAFWFAPTGGILALLFALFFYKGVMKHEEGDAAMIRIAKAVREGAYAYLARQWRIIIAVFALLVLALIVMSFLDLQPRLSALGVPVAGFFSGLCGFLGMKTATSASARTAHAARNSLNDGLKVAFRAGAVMGLCVTGFGLLDITIWFYLLTQVFDHHFTNGLVEITTVTLSFALGVSLQSLFARVGGGIYTKAADVGADLVGKVEAGIPEDDARNPATIADNVGDNVGDVAGMGADLYESFYSAILASTALAAAAALRINMGVQDTMALTIVPLSLAGMGIIASILSIYTIRTKENATLASLLKSLHIGVWTCSAIVIAASGAILYWLIGDLKEVSWVGIWVAIVVGLIAGLVIAHGTEVYTSYDHKPTRRIAEQSETGPATVIIAGIAEGMMSTWVPLLTIVITMLIAFVAAGGNDTLLMGVFGIAIAAVGMLLPLAITLATDAYGPIADNAGGNAEMSHQPPIVRQRTDMLDSLGNTTAATGKGFAIGSAALTALALLAAYIITVQTSLVKNVVHHDASLPEQKLVAYQDHGLFLVARDGQPATDRASLDAGLLLVQHHKQSILESLSNGEPFTLAWNPRSNVYVGQFENGETPRSFEIVPASTASIPDLLNYFDVTLMNPRVFAGMFIGVLLVFAFCSMTMNAVGRAAYAMMKECRRQFAIMRQGFKANGMNEQDIANPLKWPDSVTVDGKSYPDYATCVAISTAGAQKEMARPAIIAIIVPIVVGLILGIAGVMGLLAGSLISGFAVAIFMANSGGAWDNAKKYIETGQLGGKGSDAHKAGVVGDTVGDPFKDTSGPSINILFKLVAIVSIVFAGLIIQYSPIVSRWLKLS